MKICVLICKHACVGVDISDLIVDAVFQGLRGFYRGITASYFGITETMIHFVIYERLKRRLQMYR